MSEENKSLVRRYYQEAMGDLSGIDEIVAPNLSITISHLTCLRALQA